MRIINNELIDKEREEERGERRKENSENEIKEVRKRNGKKTKRNTGEWEKYHVTFSQNKMFFENLNWLTTAEAAVYLRKLCTDGSPSLNSIHKLVSKGIVRRRKFSGRLYFKRKELDYLLESSLA